MWPVLGTGPYQVGVRPESRWFLGPGLGLRVGVDLRKSCASGGLLEVLWKHTEVLDRVGPKLSGG